MKRKALPWLLVLLWMALIFYLSHQPATKSNGLSKGATEIIVETVEKVAPKVDINKSSFNHIIRKNAHFFTYLALGILVANGLRSSGVVGYRSIGLALLICVLYAVSDEVHQLFVTGRGGQVKDVIIDSAGAVVGILGCNGFIRKRS
jgi:VanZ family protein